MINKILDSYYIILDSSKKSFGEVFFHLHTRIYFAVSLVLNSMLWIGARYMVSLSGEDQIALHYNVDAGIDYYGQAKGIYSMPLVGLVALAINFVIFWSVSRSKDRKFISHILLSNALVANLIILVGMYSIYLVNFR